ncbi:MAG: type II toxin-antitoxin system RelE/ParE family toxin [Pigmentiphaga sp.]
MAQEWLAEVRKGGDPSAAKNAARKASTLKEYCHTFMEDYSGVYELVEDHRGDTFRAVYPVKVGDAVHVLHAFQKKSKSGIATPQPDVELIEKRLKAVLARYAAHRRT